MKQSDMFSSNMIKPTYRRVSEALKYAPVRLWAPASNKALIVRDQAIIMIVM